MSMTKDGPRKAGVWLRVSSDHQASKNQVPDVERFLAKEGWEEARRYTISESAWNVKGGGILTDGALSGRNGGEYIATLKQALEDAYIGHIDVLVIWALDRITREGIEALMKIKRLFAERGCQLVSLKEPWINGTSGVEDVMAALAAWQAQQESGRRSDRIKAGLARRKAEGLPVGGRKPGAKDKRPRERKTGAAAGWTEERKAALAERNRQRAAASQVTR